MKTNLSRRLILWVGLPALLLFAGVLWLSTHRSFTRLVAQTEQYTRTLASHHAAELERRLSRASKIPEGLALTLEATGFRDEAALESYLREVIRRNPEIYGSCLAFQPGAFNSGRLRFVPWFTAWPEDAVGPLKHLFFPLGYMPAPQKYYYAPYFYQWQEPEAAEQMALRMVAPFAAALVLDGPHDPIFVQLGNPEYDYFHCDWYSEPKNKGHALWTEPYFDEDGGNVVMTTYSVPMYWHGRFRGIATCDIAMTQLMIEARELQVGRTGYTIILSREGKFVSYPEAAKLMKDSSRHLSPELRREMMAGKPGFMRTIEPVSQRAAWVAYQPVQNGQFYIATIYPEAEVLEQAFRLQGEMFVLGLAGLLAVFVALVLVARGISRPVTELARAAQQIAAGNLDHEVRVAARTSEVRDLATAFRKMTKDLKMRMEELRYTTMVKERFEGELSAARTIQFSLVAKRFPAFPERPEIDLHAVIKPARAVGGDFYDFFFVDADRLCLVAADVAGKGVPAALFMAVSKTLLRANAQLAGSPAEMMAKVNNDLCDESATSGMFVSLCFAVLDVRTGKMEVCNAGHPWPYLIRREAAQPVRGDSGVALGAWRGAPYRSSWHQLERGDTFVFYTDGITEALDPEEHFYTADRLQTVLTGLAGEPVERITRTVVQDVRSFCGTHEQADDLTLLVLRWNGEGTFSPS